MGMIVGLAFGLGTLVVYASLNGMLAPWQTPAPARRIWQERRAIAAHAAAGAALAATAWILSRNDVLAAGCFAVGLAVPAALKRSRARKRQAQAREQWPDCIDDVVSGLRAGLSVGESLVLLAERGPDQMKAHFAVFAAELEATGRLDAALDRLKRTMAEPVADRVVEAMRLASRLGGHDLAVMLTSLASALRSENRARGELLARQSWTVGGARVAAVAPWVVLGLLATRPGVVDSFSTPTGTAILVFGLAATLLAYGLMLRLGRLEEAPRVLAGNES